MRGLIIALVLALAGGAWVAIHERADLARGRADEGRVFASYRATGDRVREYLCDGVEGPRVSALNERVRSEGPEGGP